MRRSTRRLGSALISLGVAGAVLIPAAPASAAPLTAPLSGAEEVPGPGDTNGKGAAEVRVNVKKGQVCFAIAVLDITLPAAAAHIHEGADGVAGDIVVTLKPPAQVGTTGIGLSSGCVKHVDESLLTDIKNNPEGYYVNVHTSDFADGAVRGQLG